MKKIGEIKGVPVVEGDANLVKNQILYKETDKGISLSKRTNGKLEEVSGGSYNNSNFEYWYIKCVPSNPDEQVSIDIPTYFRRGVVSVIENNSSVLKKCVVWPLSHEDGYYMYAIEALKAKYDVKYAGVTFTVDATSYDNWVLSIYKTLLNSLPEEEFQAAINQAKEIYVEITKEEFEEIYNSAEN